MGRKGNGERRVIGSGLLDETDQRIIALLRRNGRLPYRTLAGELGLTEATVRSRVRRLEESDTMRVVAVTDLQAAGFEMLLAVGVEVEGRPSSTVARDLGEIDGVFSVSVVVGSHDIEILAVARDQEKLNELLGRLGAVAGVRRLLPSLALDVVKNQPNWVPFRESADE